ncbi:MAG: histidinol-phosphatase HisJ family protein, partial [Eubacteriales bacterium]|nr:histidinol-phosphatase HisJ family protein [Eubacteriales bacterium]
MLYIDTHIHTNHSFDGTGTPDEICAAASASGLSAIAITDHFDADGIFEGIYDPYDGAKVKELIQKARERYSPALRVAFGLEIGQPYTYPARCEAMARELNFDFIIGSLHNLIKTPDFYYLKFDNMPQPLIERLWERYLEEIYTLLLEYRGMNINTLGHLTYPVRYITRAGRELDMKRYYDSVSQIYRKMTDYGMALEVNTSGLRQGDGMTLPDTGLIRLYRECGGELLTVGSDAHKPSDAGADIPFVYDVLAGLG